jgi:PKD repeat protein
MKNKSAVLQLICLMFIGATLACKKSNTITIHQPDACFTPEAIDPFGSYPRPADVNYIDSNFYFRNCTYDTDANTTYHWSFGDGTTSTDKNPVHRYAKRGKYTVTLEVNNGDVTTDTVQKTVSVILGQQHISLGDGKNVSPVAINELASGDFQLLGYTDINTGYFLMQLDSLFKQKSMKTLPAGYRLASMKPTGDGNFILTGTTSGFTRNNELVKLKADGTLIWNRTSSAADDTSYTATPTADGGYIVLGTHPVMDITTNIFDYARVKKFDANGNLQWDRSLYGEGMIQAKELVVEQDGVVLAGVKRSTSCSGCDSVLIAKLDNAGNLAWQNAVLGGLNTSLLSGMRTIKHTNGSYVVSVNNTKGFFIFSSTGVFLNRMLATNTIYGIANPEDGNLIILQSGFTNSGDEAVTSKMTMSGAEKWLTRPNGSEKTATGSRCCTSSWPVSVQALQRSGTLTLAQRINHTANNSNYYVILLLALDSNGNPQ